MRLHRLHIAGFMFLLCQGFACAQTYPDRLIRLVVPFSAGGNTTILGRVISQHLGKAYGQQVIVDNRPGVGGHLGAELVANAPPDGYTLVLGTLGIHAGSSIYAKLPYDPVKDLQPVVVVVEMPSVIVTHPSLPARTVKEFVALAKARPGEINYGTAGTGSANHLHTELFRMVAGVNLVHVPYKGSTPALQDVVGGHVQAMFAQLPTTLPLIEAGRLRALATTGKARAPQLPGLPTAIEAGLPQYEATSWFTVAAPSKVPAAIVQKLNAELNAMLNTPEVRTRFNDIGMVGVGGSPEAAAQYFASETAKWSKVIKARSIRDE